ncbi:MAG TPA: DUF1206 domain-containing protein [Pseudonocardiaceae bacterium]
MAIDEAHSATGSAEHAAHETEDKADEARHSRAMQVLGRFGDICYGVVHVVVAILAVQLIFGRPGHEVDQKGAVATIAAEPFGEVVLWFVAIGLVAFAVWQLLMATTGFGYVEDEGKRIRRRIGVGGRGVAVLFIAVSTFRLLVSSSAGKSSNGESQTFTAKLMSVTGGRLLVGAVGVGIVVAAAVIAWRGVGRSFVEDLDLSRVSPKTARLTELLGAIGFAAKGVVYAIVGVLVLVAAIQFNPKRAVGLDGALRTLAGQPLGIGLLVVAALGLACYGGYCFVEARCRRS